MGRRRRREKPWITNEILDLCDIRRGLKNNKSTAEGRAEYRKINKTIRREMKKAEEQWIADQCENIEDNLSRNNTKEAFKVVKDLTQVKTTKVNTIQDKNGNTITEEKEIIQRWTEYCSELYNHQSRGDLTLLDVPESNNEDDYPILREEVESAIKSLKCGKSAGVDNVPAELLKHGGEATIDILTAICNKIWQTGEWPTTWTQSLIIVLPKKGNLQLCQNYRTISLISHASKIMLRIILNRLRPQAEEIIAEEQAGFREGRSTTEQIFNLRLLCEKHLQHQQELYHVFVDFKKAFDRVWHEALWATMKKINIGKRLISTIQQLYANATSAVLAHNVTGEWFHTTVGVRQGCLLSPSLFNIFLERIMIDALEEHEGTISIGGRTITNLRFADDIDGLAGNEEELKSLVNCLDNTSTRYGMEISAEKTKVMTNEYGTFTTNISVHGTELESVNQFKYLGAIISDNGSHTEILSRSAQTLTALAKLRKIWRDKNIALKYKIRLMHALVLSIFLYACESWTLTAELQRKIQAVEMKCYRYILNISYLDRITNERVRQIIVNHIGPHEDLLTTVKKRKLRWYGHTTRASGLSKIILQGTVRGGRKRGGQRKKWTDNISEWTARPFSETQALAHDRERWRDEVYSASRRRPNDTARS